MKEVNRRQFGRAVGIVALSTLLPSQIVEAAASHTTIQPLILLPVGYETGLSNEYVTNLTGRITSEQSWWKAQGYNMQMWHDNEIVRGVRQPWVHYLHPAITRYQGDDQAVYFNIAHDVSGCWGDILLVFDPLEDFAFAVIGGRVAAVSSPCLEGICGRWHPHIADWKNRGVSDVVASQVNTMRHEIGHCLGYGHFPNTHSVMGSFWENDINMPLVPRGASRVKSVGSIARFCSLPTP